jgi:hypothetical protein
MNSVSEKLAVAAEVLLSIIRNPDASPEVRLWTRNWKVNLQGRTPRSRGFHLDPSKAEDFARNQVAGVLVDWEARWRDDPAIDKQLYHLRWWRVRVSPGLTNGQPHDQLTTVWGGR